MYISYIYIIYIYIYIHLKGYDVYQNLRHLYLHTAVKIFINCYCLTKSKLLSLIHGIIKRGISLYFHVSWNDSLIVILSHIWPSYKCLKYLPNKTLHIILSSDESGSFRVAGSKSGETIKACNCSKFEYNLKNQRKHDHCPTCKEGKLKWNFDKHISACKTIGM